MNVLRLIPEQGNEAIAIDQDRVLLGRDPASDVHLRDASVSRRHAEIRKGLDGEWLIIDLDSGNGVLIDGVRTPEGVLESGQRLHIGNVAFRVEVDRGDGGSTVILKRSPLARASRTTVLEAPPPDLWPASQPPSAPPTALVVTALVVSALVVASFGLLALYWPRPQAPARTAAPLPTPLPSEAERSTPNPVPAAPPPVTVAAAPRGALLISADVRTELMVDGQRSGAVDAGGLRRLGVVPGDHIVSFLVAEARHDQLVHVNAGEQSVVRFSGGATSLPSPSPASAPPPPQASPTSAGLRVATLSPIPSPTPGVLAATPSPIPVPAASPPAVVQEIADPDLQSGIAATRRGDYFRALLVLKDVVKRIERERKARRDLALAHAYLAWTYHGLGRPDEARASAEKALQANPEVLTGMENPPSEVASLFKRRR
jgi:predicted component of type VI protein secretion system